MFKSLLQEDDFHSLFLRSLFYACFRGGTDRYKAKMLQNNQMQ